MKPMLSEYSMRDLLPVLACLCLVVFGSGCANDRLVDVLPIGGRQEFKRGDFEVHVENPSGSVSVQVVRGSEPTVRVRPVHAAAGRRTAPIDLGRATFVRTATGTKLRVIASDDAGPVHVSVTVPSCAGVKITNADGPVDVRGASGSIDIQNDSTGEFAHVNLQTEWDLNGPIAIHSGYGDIVLHSGQESAGIISSHTPRGKTDVSAAQMRVRGMSQDHGFFNGTVNGGTNAWKFNAANGSLRLTFDRYVEPLVK